MSKPCSLFKHKIKRKKLNKINQDGSLSYVRDLYLKDFEYIGPDRMGVSKNGFIKNRVEMKDGRNARGCKLLLELFLIEALKGLKNCLYKGSLHGVKYIFEPTFSRKERFIWVTIVLISVILCAVNIIDFFIRSPLALYLNVIDSAPTPIWAIPFPTIVLCPHLHVKRSFATISSLNNLERFFAGLVCPKMKVQNIRLQHRLTVEEIKMLQDFIIQGSPSCKEVVRGCTWKASNRSEWSGDECCEKLFSPVLTPQGLCFAFNSLPLFGFTNETLPWIKTVNPNAKAENVEWNVDDGYPKNMPHNLFMTPWRTTSTGDWGGLRLELYLNSTERQTGCEGNNFGFSVMVMAPTHNLYTSTTVRIPMNEIASIHVIPETHRTESSLRSLDPISRECFYQDEKKLLSFSSYTASNCKYDELLRLERKVCGCILFHSPRKDISQSVCSTKSDYDCISKLRETVEQDMVKMYYINSVKDTAAGRSRRHTVSCLSPCNYINYNTQVFFSKMMGIGNSYGQRKRKKDVIQVNIHFQNSFFFGQHRQAEYDAYKFIGAIGGILSMFLGFSIISMVEIVYFVIWKPVRNTITQFYNQ